MKITHAILTPPSIPYELAAHSGVALHQKTSQHLRTRIARFKDRAKKHLQRRREAAKRVGYQDGLVEGKAVFAKLTGDIIKCHHAAIEMAAERAKEIALRLADQLVQLHIDKLPESLLPLVNRATTLLRTSSNLVLLVHPRLHKSVESIRDLLPLGLRLEVNNAPGAPDFILASDSGAVEFAWREALAALAHETTVSAE